MSEIPNNAYSGLEFNVEQASNPEYNQTIKDERKQHVQEQNELEKRLRNTLYVRGGNVMVRDKKEYESMVAEAGLDLEGVPDKVRSIYVTIANLITSPEKRLNSNTDKVRLAVNTFTRTEDEIDRTLYGMSASVRNQSLNFKIGGLYKSLEDALDQRYESCITLKSLDKLMNSTYSRIKRIETEMSEANEKQDYQGVKELRDEHHGYRFDLRRQKKQRDGLLKTVRKTDGDYKRINGRVKQLEAFQTKICMNRIIAERLLESAEGIIEDNKYAPIGTVNLGSVQKDMDQLAGIAGAFVHKNGEMMSDSVASLSGKLNEQNLPQSYNFVQELDAIAEKEDDDTVALIDQILLKPFPDTL